MTKQGYSRRKFTTQLLGGVATVGITPTTIFAQQNVSKSAAEIDWYDVKQIGVEGKGWKNTKRYFDRLPAKAEGIVREKVWNLSRHSAGMCMRFETNSPNIYVRYNLYLSRLSMSHMPATGVSGLDLYAKNAEGNDRWVAVVRPDNKQMNTPLAENLRSGKRQYTIYLPLYNGVDDFEVGVSSGQTFTPIAPRKEKPLLFYGTSIMHGACASRPGIAFPAILGRRLNRPTINLGFSGNGRMEAEVSDLLAEVDPCAYVIDCLPNMNNKTVSERAVPLVKRIRQTHPETPLLLVEDRSYTNSQFFPQRMAHHLESRKALRAAYATLKADGVKNVFYLNGEGLLGTDGEGATDGSHPNDLGMMRYADAYEPVLRAMLKYY